MKLSHLKWLRRVPKGTEFIIFLIAVAAFLCGIQSHPAEAQISIISPPEGTLLVPDQSVTVQVEPSPGLVLQKVLVSLVPDGTLEFAESPPFDILLVIPESSALGPAEIVALAIDQDGNLFNNSIPVSIESPVSPQSIQAVPESIFFSQTDENDSLVVLGMFPDGVRRDLSQSAATTYLSANPQVLTVDPDGHVQAVGPGTTTVTVSHKGLSMTVPASVGKFELRGDLDGDGDVDQNDLNILLAAQNTSATGPGDPRDLNNDGSISNLDMQILTTLCSRLGCAAGNTPPTANAGPDQTVECSSASGASVVLDGSASSDPDNDPLTYTWTGPFGTASGPKPTVSLPLGTNTGILTVNDGKGGMASDTVTVKVVDTTPPSIGSVTANPNVLWPPNHKMVPVTVAVSASDTCSAAQFARSHQ